MYFIVLCGIAVTLILLIAIFTYFLSDSKKESKPEVRQERNAQLPGARRQRLQAARNARTRHNVDQSDEEEETNVAPIDLPEGKVGAKKMAKLQAKAEKKAQREADEKERQEKKKKQELADAERQKQEEKEKLEEQKLIEEEKKAREEKERREHEEYLKMKEAFSVEEEGFEAEEEEGENLLKDFVNYIKENKVVVLEDLGNKFKMKTQTVIDRIQDLQKDCIITGVIDDRGKFIYISQDELNSVAKFVKQRGRVSIIELAESSNQLINMNPKIFVS